MLKEKIIIVIQIMDYIFKVFLHKLTIIIVFEVKNTILFE